MLRETTRTAEATNMYRATIHATISQDSLDTEQKIYDTTTIVAWSPPSWEKELQDITVHDRQPGVELICICRGLTNPSTKWFHKGREVFSDFHMKLRQVADTATLTIKNIREQDRGKFKCVMTGENGELETSCILSIKDPEKIEPPVFVKELHDVEVEEGEKLELAVEVKGTPPMVVFWYHNNLEITHDSPHFLLASLGQVHILTLLHAASESSGEYVCEAYNDFGDTDTFCFVEVREVEHPEPPDFVTCPNTLTALEGETVTFTCQVKGQPMPTVLWERGGVVIATSQKFKITKIQDQHSLTVYDTDQSDAGEYICHLHSPQSDASHVCSLHVISKNNSEGSETAEPLKSRSVHVDGLHLTSRTDFRSLQKGEHSSSSPVMSRRFNNQKLKDMAENEETTVTKTGYTTSFKTTVGVTSSVEPFDAPQTDGDKFSSSHQYKKWPRSDSPKIHHDIKSDIKQQSDVSLSHLTEMSPDVMTTSNSILNKSYKKADEKRNVNTDVTDFRSVLKHRDRTSPSHVAKSQPSQSHNNDFRNILSHDKVKQHRRSQFQTDAATGSITTDELVNVPTVQSTTTVLSQSLHFATIPHFTSSVSSNNYQNDKNLANKRIESNINDLQLTSTPKNLADFPNLDSSTQSSINLSSKETQSSINLSSKETQSSINLSSKETQSSINLSTKETRDWRKSRVISPEDSSTFSQSLESSNMQDLQSSKLGKSGRENVNIQGNNSEIIRDINYLESLNISDVGVAGKNLDNNIRTQDKYSPSDTKSAEILFKSEIQILGTKRDRVTSLVPNEEINIITSLNTKCSSDATQVRSDNYLNGRDRLSYESEEFTSKPESQKEDTIQSHNVSVIHFSPQMSSTPPRREELKLEVTSVSISMPLRSSTSSPRFESRPHSDSMPLPVQLSGDNKQVDVDDVFTYGTEERVNPDHNTSNNDYRQTLQSFGSMFTWEKAPWEGTNIQEGNWSEISTPLETKMNDMTENVIKNRSASLKENRLDSNLYLDSKAGTPSNFDSGISSQASNMSDSIIDSSSEDFRSITLISAVNKGTPDLLRSRTRSASTECVYADVKLKPVSKSEGKVRKSQVWLSAPRIKKPKNRDLSHIFPISKEDNLQKNIKTSDSSTTKITAVTISNSYKTSVSQSKYEKLIQDSKIRAVAEKYEKSGASSSPRTNTSGKFQGIGAKYEENVRDVNVSNKSKLYTSENPAKNNLDENPAKNNLDENPAKPPISREIYSGTVLDKIQQWKTAETASSGKPVKKMLGTIGKSNSNNAILESGGRSYLDKVQYRLDQKRNSLQMNITPTISNSDNKSVQLAEDVGLSNLDFVKPSQSFDEVKDNLKSASLIQISDVSQKRELFENGNKKNLSVNVSESESRNVKADIPFDRNMIESRNVKGDISFDRNMKELESRNMKDDVSLDRKMKESESRNMKDDASQDMNMHINTVELSVRNKVVIPKTVQNEQDARPEWVNRKPVNNIEAKIKANTSTGNQQDKNKPDWINVRPSSYIQQIDSAKGNKQKSKLQLDPVYRNTSRNDEQEILISSNVQAGGDSSNVQVGGDSSNVQAGGDSSAKLPETNFSNSGLKQIGSCDIDELNYDGTILFRGKSQAANTSKSCNSDSVLIQNSDIKLQMTSAKTTGITSMTTSNSPSATVAASAKLISMTLSAATITTVTERVVGKVVNSTIPQTANEVTADLVATNRKIWETSKRSVEPPEASEALASSSPHASKSWRKDLQVNNLNHPVAIKLNSHDSREPSANDQQSHMIGTRSTWGKQKGLKSLPVFQAHETGLSLHHEALGSSLDDSESVLSTASISSSSSDASNVTVDSGYPRNTLGSFVDIDRSGHVSKDLQTENDGSFTPDSNSRNLDEVNSLTADGFRMKEKLVESSRTKKNSEADLRPSGSDRGIRTLSRDQKYMHGFEQVRDEISKGETSDESSKPGKSERSHVRANDKFVKRLEEIKQKEFTKDGINKTQETVSQVSKDSEIATDVKENEEVADLSNDFGTIRKYSKKRRKNLEKQINDGVSGSADNKLVSSVEPDMPKSRFSHRFREYETNTETIRATLVSNESSRRWKSKETTTLHKSEESERYLIRKSRFELKFHQDHKTATVGTRTEDNKSVAIRPSDLDLNPNWKSSRPQIKKDALHSKESEGEKIKLNTSTAEVVSATVTAGCSASLSTAASKAQTQLCPPSFPQPLQDTVVMFGSKAVLRCRLVGNPRPEVKWLLNQKLIEPSKDIAILDTDECSQLTVRETFTDHVGDYACWAKNSLGTVSSHCTLSLEAPNRTESRALEGRRFAPPKIVLLSPSALSLPRGSPLALTLTFLGEPKPEVRWIHGDRELISDSHVQIVTEGNTSCLTIKSVKQSDAGKMSVCLTSCTGTDQASVNICIEDVPGAPVGRPHIYDIDCNSASLSWYGSTSNEGSQVTHYVIEAKTQQEQTWDVIVPYCKDVSCHILGLNPCTSYQFRVLAANKHGLSIPSEHSEKVVTSDHVRSPSDYESDAYADVFTPSVEFQTQDDFPFEPREVKVNTQDKFEDVFELDKEVGKGKFGIVYKCKHRKDGTVWAAKIVKCREKDKGVIRREIDIMNKLRHPKLLLLWDAYESQRQMVLVMEYVGAGELFERVIGEDFVLTEVDCVHFLRQICQGVNYMHENNILHLDLKPENILCMAEDSNRIKIIDFGLAQFHKAGQSTKVLFGTPEFIAPEVINYEEIGFVTDMWSIGVICYVLLSGLSPFLGDNDAETLANVTCGEFDFDDEAFDEISDEAKHFISQLLVMKKEKRMLTDHCLSHVWLNPKKVGCFRSRRLNTERLKRFMVRRKWLKTGNAVLAISRLLKSSGLSAVSSNNNILTSAQSSSTLLTLPAQRNVEEVAEGVRYQNESPSVVRSSAQLSFKELEYISQGVSEKINNVEENSTFSEDCSDSSTTVQSMKNTVSEEMLTNPTDNSLNVGRLDASSLSEVQTNHNTDDNQVINDNSHILATSSADVNHNLNQTASSMFLESTATAVDSKEGVTNRRETKQNTLTVTDRDVLQVPVFTKSMMSSTTCVGDVARFDVVVIGNPIPTITWHFEDEEIHPDSRHILDSNIHSRTFSLVIRNIEEDDEGEYTCRAINSQGENICVAELCVLEM